MAVEKTGRNDPCPCGSGKKFKRCCLGTGEVTFRRSPHHFQLKGKNAEQFIQQLANKTFLADWCYANPRLPNGKELCDLLVIFDTTALMWQINAVVSKITSRSHNSLPLGRRGFA